MFIWRITYTMSSPRAIAARKLSHLRDSFDKTVLGGLSEAAILSVMSETQTHSHLLKSENPFDCEHVPYLVKYLSPNGMMQGLIDKNVVVEKIEYLGDVCYTLDRQESADRPID